MNNSPAPRSLWAFLTTTPFPTRTDATRIAEFPPANQPHSHSVLTERTAGEVHPVIAEAMNNFAY